MTDIVSDRRDRSVLKKIEESIEKDLKSKEVRQEISESVGKLSKEEKLRILEKFGLDANKDKELQPGEVVQELEKEQQEIKRDLEEAAKEKHPQRVQHLYKEAEKEIKEEIKILQELGLHTLEEHFGQELTTFMRLERDGKMHIRNVEKNYKQYLLQIAEQYRTGTEYLGSKYFYELYRKSKHLFLRRYDILLHYLDAAHHVKDNDLVEHLQDFARHNSEKISRRNKSRIVKNKERKQPYITQGLIIVPITYNGRAHERELHNSVRDLLEDIEKKTKTFGHHVVYINKDRKQKKWTYYVVITAEHPYKIEYPQI